jgi:histone-lysine N-methyltransferase SETD1
MDTPHPTLANPKTLNIKLNTSADDPNARNEDEKENERSTVKDPRLFCAAIKKKRNYALEPLELPVPKFKHDQYWVGPVPAKEVTFANLNDNIDKKFLEEMCAKFGELAECRVYYHPKNRKHLGIGKVLFESQKSAKDCCLALNSTTKMGNKMTVFLDTMGNERAKMVEQLCSNNLVQVSPGVKPSSSNSPSSSSPQQQAQPEMPARTNSLESRIAALFNININNSAGSSSMASSSEHAQMPSFLGVNQSGLGNLKKKFFFSLVLPLCN